MVNIELGYIKTLKPLMTLIRLIFTDLDVDGQLLIGENQFN
jgi:hypothetical protein